MPGHLPQLVRRGSVWVRHGRPDIPIGSVVSTPNPPTTVTASNVTATSLRVSWSGASASPADPIQFYRIYLDRTRIDTIAASNTFYDITGLTADTQYEINVTAENSVGNSKYNQPPLFVTTTGAAAGVPGAPTNVAGTATSETTATVTWAVASGTVTGYRVFLNGTQYGGDLDPADRSLAITGLTSATAYTPTVRAFNGSGAGPTAAGAGFTTNSSTDSLHAGHTPNHVMVGMAASDSGYPRPTFDESLTILGQPVHEHRLFVGQWVTLGQLNSWLNSADADGVYAWCSFKPDDANSWVMEQQIANGQHDTTLNIIRDFAIARRNASKPAFAMTFHHEPSGDGNPLSGWAAMQEYCSNYFAGWKNGVYNAANDVSDIMAWSSIANGFWWKPTSQGRPADIATAYPQSLIDAFRNNRSILACDTYDGSPNDTSNHPNSYGFSGGQIANRMKRQASEFIAWGRSKNAGAMGLGEFSVADDEFYELWTDVFGPNRDKLTIVNYYQSNTNSRWEWRAIPDSYPNYNTQQGVNASNLRDYPGGKEIGGTPVTEARLVQFRQMLDASRAPEWTGPVA